MFDYLNGICKFKLTSSALVQTKQDNDLSQFCKHCSATFRSWKQASRLCIKGNDSTNATYFWWSNENLEEIFGWGSSGLTKVYQSVVLVEPRCVRRHFASFDLVSTPTITLPAWHRDTSVYDYFAQRRFVFKIDGLLWKITLGLFDHVAHTLVKKKM